MGNFEQHWESLLAMVPSATGIVKSSVTASVKGIIKSLVAARRAMCPLWELFERLFLLCQSSWVWNSSPNISDEYALRCALCRKSLMKSCSSSDCAKDSGKTFYMRVKWCQMSVKHLPTHCINRCIHARIYTYIKISEIYRLNWPRNDL